MDKELLLRSSPKDAEIKVRVPRQLKNLAYRIAAEQQITVSIFLREKLYELAQLKPKEGG